MGSRSRYVANFVVSNADISALYSANIIESTNLFYTNARARTSITLTSNTGDGTYDNSTGVINITRSNTEDWGLITGAIDSTDDFGSIA
jgi:hypothetical protein